jgi:hypothetical protein
MSDVCPCCDKPTEKARRDLGLVYCFACATRHPTPKYKGAMVYAHKTGATIELMAPETFVDLRRYSRRIGQRSTLRNVLFAGGRAV